VGRVGCWQPEGWPGFEVGWALRRQFWRKGYATEAALRAVDFAFNTLGRERVISLIQPENSASVAVALRLGMSFDGYAEVLSRPVLVYGLDRAAGKNG
jgi:RimJ/RimL family protein N-acetyltransferase